MILVILYAVSCLQNNDCLKKCKVFQKIPVNSCSKAIPTHTSCKFCTEMSFNQSETCLNTVCLKLTNGLSNQNCKWCFHCTAQFFCTLSLVTWSKHHWSAKILAALYNLRFNCTPVGHSFFIFGLGFIVNFVCSLFSQPHLWGFPRTAGLPPGALAKCWLFICGGF